MNKIRVYNEKELEILKNNSNVISVKNKSQIQYSNNFKLWAIKEKLENPEKTARQIFESGGFDMNILDERTPQKRLCSWIKKYKMFGSDYFIDNNKYTYKSKTKVEDNKFRKYVKKCISNPKFVAFIIDKDEKGNLRFKNLVSLEDESNNNKS